MDAGRSIPLSRRAYKSAVTHYLTPCEITVQQAVKVASKSRNRLEPRGCGLCDSDMNYGSEQLFHRV